MTVKELRGGPVGSCHLLPEVVESRTLRSPSPERAHLQERAGN